MTTPRSASVAFILVVILLDTLGIGLIIPVLSRLIDEIVEGRSDDEAEPESGAEDRSQEKLHRRVERDEKAVVAGGVRQISSMASSSFPSRFGPSCAVHSLSAGQFRSPLYEASNAVRCSSASPARSCAASLRR